MASKVWICLFMVTISLTGSVIASSEHSESELETHSSSESESLASKEFVVTLDHSNFTEFVSTHNFVVVEFYAPWCGACKQLAPEYEKAASIFSKDDPSIILAKVDANEESNKALASSYGLRGYPTIKILKFGGSVVHDYKGPHDANGIIAYLNKHIGPASTEIKSSEDATTRIDDVKKIVIVGVFPEFTGEKFENFTTLAEKLRAEYDFAHTTDAKHLPRGDLSVSGPTIRLFKPFDELFVDIQEFDIDVLEKLVGEASIPLITLFNKDEDNRQYVIKFFESTNNKAMLFFNFTGENTEAFKSKYREVAEEFKGQEIIFSIGDVDANQAVLNHFGIKKEQVPFIILQTSGEPKYLKPNVETHQISSWLKDFKDGKLKPHKKSEAIPEVNDEPVKVVVGDTLEDVLFNSGKNVFLEFYAPWCGHCKNLAPILDEIAVSFQNDDDIVIAKIDATANDYPQETFEVKGYPSLFFQSASGTLLKYEEDRTKEDIISFINKNRGDVVKKLSDKDEL